MEDADFIDAESVECGDHCLAEKIVEALDLVSGFELVLLQLEDVASLALGSSVSAASSGSFFSAECAFYT